MPRFPRAVRKTRRQRRLQFEPLDPRLALCTFVGGVVSVDSVWGDTINGYCVQADLEIAPGITLTVNDNVPVTSANPLNEIRVDGTLDIQGADFSGAGMEVIVRTGGSLTIEPGSTFSGERLSIEPGSSATINGGTFGIPVELLTSAATVANSNFLLPDGVAATPSTVELLYDNPTNSNTFAAGTIVQVQGTGVSDATWKPYPNILEYQIKNAAAIAAGASITLEPGLLVRMDEDTDELTVAGSLVTNGTEFVGFGTKLTAVSGGHMELNRDSNDVPTYIHDGTVKYETGSSGQLGRTVFELSELIDFAPGVVLDRLEFLSANPVEIWPSLAYDLYDSSFAVPATIRLQGPVSASPKADPTDRDIQSYFNIDHYVLSGDITVGNGERWLVGSANQPPRIETDDPAFDIIVAAGGFLEARGAAFAGVATEIIAENGSNVRLIDGTTFAGDGLTYAAGSTGLLRCTQFGGNLRFDSASTAQLIYNDLTAATVTAAGSSVTTISIINQFWGTTNPATIEGRVFHRNDNPALPQVSFAPFVVSSPYPCAAFQPAIGLIPDQFVESDTTVGPLSFDITDVDTAATLLTVTGRSGNTLLVPNANIIVIGTGGTRTVQVIPAPGELGTAVITLQVQDTEGFTAETSFLVTVLPPDSSPALEPIPDVVLTEDAQTAPLILFASDVQSPTANLNLYISESSNPDLLPEGLQQLYFDGTNWRLIIQPAPDRFTPSGQTIADTLTVAVDDGSLVTTQTFHVRVTPVDDPPLIAIDSTTVPVGVAGAAVEDVQLFDADPADAISVNIVNGGADFEIVAGVLQLKPGISWVSGQSDDITLRAFNPSNPSSFTVKTIHVLATTTAPLMRVEFVVEDAFGFPLTQITPGDSFYIAGYVTDLRGIPEGVKQTYLNIQFDPAATTSGVGEFGTSFPYNQFANPIGLGEVNDLGAAADPLLPVLGRQMLFRGNITGTSSLDPNSNTSGTVFVDLDSNPLFPTQLVDSSLPAGFVTLSASQVEIIPASVRIAPTLVYPQMVLTNDTGTEFIAAGSTTTSTTDGTEFGTFDANSPTGFVDHTFAIVNVSGTLLNLIGTPLVSIAGPGAADFSVVSNPSNSIGTAATSNFQIRFNPAGVGLRQAVVTIFTDSNIDNPYTFVISGVGTEINQPPTDMLLDSNTIIEKSFGAVVGRLTVVDASISDTFTFTVSDPRFEVLNGRLKLKSNFSLVAFNTPPIPLDITATDAGGLAVTRSFVITVIEPPFVATLTLRAVDEQNQPVLSVVPFQRFRLIAEIADTRQVPLGVQSAYFDISYPSPQAFVNNNNPVEFGPLYPNQQFAGLSTFGLLDEIGARADSSPVGSGTQLLFTSFLQALLPGPLNFVPSLANNSLTTVYGGVSPVQTRDIRLQPLQMTVATPQFPWHNPNKGSDVVGLDDVVDILDILSVVFHFNFLNRDLTQLVLPAIPGFVDVVADNTVDIRDILGVVFEFNLQQGGGEGETVVLTETAGSVSVALSAAGTVEVTSVEVISTAEQSSPSPATAAELLFPLDAAADIAAESPPIDDAILAELAANLIAANQRKLRGN